MKVLILGANSDVAEALASLLAQKKHELFLAGRSEEKLSALKNDLEIRFECKAHNLHFDALDFDSHEQFYNSLPEKPDWVICAFGLLFEQDQAEDNLKLAMQSYKVNFLGAVSIIDIIAKDFATRKSGVIVGISSVAGDRGRGSNYAYGSAKAGFSAYLSGLRNKLNTYGVHVLTVKPGFIKTKMTDHLKLPKLLTATPEQVARKIEKAIRRKCNVIYVKWFWRYIMIVIKLIPEPIFKKLSL
ncbi:MAG: SDR family oxidoreductase [Cyclobacteriaceae bacterium]|nr:SDR family oxidoreductase [Cyclobacteriaceae bacterium]